MEFDEAPSSSFRDGSVEGVDGWAPLPFDGRPERGDVDLSHPMQFVQRATSLIEAVKAGEDWNKRPPFPS